MAGENIAVVVAEQCSQSNPDVFVKWEDNREPQGTLE